jgi:hypothetical protein
MRLLLLVSLILQFGCATKYIIPGNRFITPESQGGTFRGQLELQQTKANQFIAIADDGDVDNGVDNLLVDRTGFLFSTSLLDSMDLIWSHTGGANSLLGAKFQLLGGSRSSKSTGQKLSISAAFGGNEHETEGDTGVEFELTGQEYMLAYGWRFSEFWLMYSSFSYAKYTFAGIIQSSDPLINGLRPEYETKAFGLNLGTEISAGSLFGKLELGYQKLSTSDTKEISHFTWGYAVGMSW